jgi:hypothetical protein
LDFIKDFNGMDSIHLEWSLALAIQCHGIPRSMPEKSIIENGNKSLYEPH